MDNLEQVFNEIVEQYRERLYWHIRSLVCSHEDADDVLQDTFIKIWKALPSFRGDSELFTWAYRIATNESLNYLHKQKIRSALSFESLRTTLENRIDDDPWFDGDALQRDLAKAIQGLPEKQRVVFQLRYFEELPYEQISEITGTSVGALKASYHIAYEKIKEKLKLSSL